MEHHLPSRTYSLVLAFFFLLVVVFAGWLLFEASGWQVLRSPWRLVKTGLISFDVHPAEQLTIKLNGEVMASQQLTFTDLVPGRYQIEISRPDYQPWEVTTELVAGEAKSYPAIVLFLSQPIVTTVDQAEAKIYASVLSHPERFQAGLQIFDNEIWANEKLVTRYSEPILQALWLPDNAHLLVVLSNSLHVVEQTGGHDLTLLTTSVDQPISRFAPLAGGEKLIIETGPLLALLTITAPYQRMTLPSL